MSRDAHDPPHTPQDPSLDFQTLASNTTKTIAEREAIIVPATEFIIREIYEIRSKPPPTYGAVIELFKNIKIMFKQSGFISFRQGVNNPKVVAFATEYYKLVDAVIDKWMTDMTPDKMAWIATELNLMNKIPPKYIQLVVNDVTFMNYIRANSSLNSLNNTLMMAKPLQSVASSAAPVASSAAPVASSAAPVASLKQAQQAAAERLATLIDEILSVDDVRRKQAMADIAILMSMNTNGGTRNKKSKNSKKKSRKSRKTKSRRH